jgi:choline dehydrogenase
MVAEKAADLITDTTPLPPLTVPWYRHGSGQPLHPPGDPRNDAWDTLADPPSAAGAQRAADTTRGTADTTRSTE